MNAYLELDIVELRDTPGDRNPSNCLSKCVVGKAFSDERSYLLNFRLRGGAPAT